ncbi:antitoxin [Streptomyces melanogenes]|uniref:antitoxin n=1 Tax=Streptomyces melanogenes TaxID=67326 RepID=UPI0037AA4B3E
MGILDRFKDQAHNKADDLVESAGDEVDERTGGRFAGQVDQAQDKAKEALGIGASAREPAAQEAAGQRPVEQQASEQQTSEQPPEQPEQQQPPA